MINNGRKTLSTIVFVIESVNLVIYFCLIQSVQNKYELI